ncbi:threonine synthase [Endozoicomonas sp. Mp262]|uniref:threonine synthase n=1 Tax=Endozoicomonas sp. Mp262 TaxID=2919499 RepID=UPI0021E0967C
MVAPLKGITREQIDQSERSIWRYKAALPVNITNSVSLGEGCTPLVKRTFNGASCRFKLEWFAPTGSFKDRGTAVMLSYLQQLGITTVIEDSSGNGGSSVAGFAAAAGIQAKIFVPASTQPAKIAQTRAYGAEVILVPGPREATEAAAIEAASSGSGFYASHNWHPFFLQGTKTLGYEIWEDLGFNVPDNIIIPAGAGSNLLGCYLAFKELMASGEIRRMPKLFVSQPANCAPIHTSFQASVDDYMPQEFKPTIAEGTAIKKPIRLKQILAAIHESGGGTVAIAEDDIQAASLTLARQGLYVEPTCAHAAAGFTQLLESGQIHKDDNTVVIMTGTGLKALGYYAAQFQ